MKRAMLYPALLFLISPLFGADADYSAMFGSDKLKAASAAYEKFGYVSPLVELAKIDAAGAKKARRTRCRLEVEERKKLVRPRQARQHLFSVGRQGAVRKSRKPRLCGSRVFRARQNLPQARRRRILCDFRKFSARFVQRDSQAVQCGNGQFCR